MHEVVGKTESAIKRYEMLAGGDKVLAAVSGGADSLALLFALLELKNRFGIELHVFHLDHMMRGGASKKDADFVRSSAAALKVPATIESYDVPAYIKKHKLSPEDGARRIRYELMAKTAEQVGANKQAVGHTADDQVETYLMRILRGSGLEGLTSIPPVNGPIIRPLISVWRAETVDYVRSLGIEPLDDETNTDGVYMRNRIRNGLLPLIEREYNSGFKEEALREIDSIGADLELLDLVAGEAAEELLNVYPSKIEIDHAGFMDLHPALRRRVLRSAIKLLKGDLNDITFRNNEDVIDKVAGGNSGSSLELPGGLTAYRLYDMICIEFSSDFHQVAGLPEEPLALEVPGTIEIKGPGFFISAEIIDGGKAVVTPDRDKAFIDAGTLPGGLEVRRVREGDRFHPLGMTGTKKVQDFFTDSKVSRKDRESALVVDSGGKIVWLVGHRLDDAFKVTASTSEVLVLRIEKG